jgi:chlorobactene glucosyltransferase
MKQRRQTTNDERRMALHRLVDLPELLIHLIGIGGALRAINEVRVVHRQQTIPYDTAGAALGSRVSLLIPARDEEHTIGRCLAGALAQHYPQLEICVLDDHSTDGTAAVVASFMPDERLRLLQGQPLPPGWAGKCYACQQLAAATSGDWLLFIDADTQPQPGLVSALIAYAEQQQLDLLSIWPFLELPTFWERAILPAFYGLITLVYPTERVNDPQALPGEYWRMCSWLNGYGQLVIGSALPMALI